MLPICFEPFIVAQANLLLLEGNVLCQVCTLPESAAIAFSLRAVDVRSLRVLQRLDSRAIIVSRSTSKTPDDTASVSCSVNLGL